MTAREVYLIEERIKNIFWPIKKSLAVSCKTLAFEIPLPMLLPNRPMQWQWFTQSCYEKHMNYFSLFFVMSKISMDCQEI